MVAVVRSMVLRMASVLNTKKSFTTWRRISTRSMARSAAAGGVAGSRHSAIRCCRRRNLSSRSRRSRGPASIPGTPPARSGPYASRTRSVACLRRSPLPAPGAPRWSRRRTCPAPV
ncbi:hypothetical protein G6F57_022075 [Rhizopus arrhizus]|nr:hypothetical protein G6F57_022075 [Rhizopus arrhizus]